MSELVWDSVMCAIDGPLIVAVWTGKPPLAADVKALTGAVAAHAKSRGERTRYGFLVGIPPNMPVPSSDARDTITAEMRRLDPLLGCGVTVIPHKGFAGSALRAILSTLQLLARPGHPESVVSSVEEAAAILSRFVSTEKLGVMPPERIIRTYEGLCARCWLAA